MDKANTRPIENAHNASSIYAQKSHRPVKFNSAKKANICSFGFPRTVRLNGKVAKIFRMSLQDIILNILGWKSLRR